MNFEELCLEEPKLRKLYEAVKLAGANRKSVDWIWYHDIKPKMKCLVGWFAENEKLRTAEAWDLSYRILYDLLRSRKGRGVKGN